LTLLYGAINGLVAIPMDELEHTSRCTRHCGPDAFIVLQSRVDAYKFSFFPRTVSDWNSLPSSAKSTPSVNSFKTALHRLSGVTNSHQDLDNLLSTLFCYLKVDILLQKFVFTTAQLHL